MVQGKCSKYRYKLYKFNTEKDDFDFVGKYCSLKQISEDEDVNLDYHQAYNVYHKKNKSKSQWYKIIKI